MNAQEINKILTDAIYIYGTEAQIWMAIEEVFTINNYVKYVDDMLCPLWDGMKSPYIICHNLEIL